MLFTLIIDSILLGFGLAMDAFSVSIADALTEPEMSKKKMCGISGMFGIFQAIMPLIGWTCIHTIVQHLGFVEKWIPWIALVFLCFVGTKMIIEGRETGGKQKTLTITLGIIIVQAIATSIDAFSVGFMIAEYDLLNAVICALVIATVTFLICMVGFFLGKKSADVFSGKAQLVGGIVLIVIGIKVFITGVF